MTDILQRLKNNDGRAFEEVFNTYKAPMYFSILKIIHNPIDTEDVMMITFEKAFAGIRFFIPKFKLSTWIYEIAKNTAFDFLRAKERRPKGCELDTRIQYKELNPEQELIIKDQFDIVQKGIEYLTQPNFREIMTMYAGGYKIKEICKELNLPQGTVVNYILRAKQELKNLIA